MCQRGGYKQHYVCFTCRKMFRQHKGYPEDRTHLCPQCRQPMARLGREFWTPRKNNTEQWKKLEMLYHAGVTFDTCGCNGAGYRPKYLREIPDFIKGYPATRDLADAERFGIVIEKTDPRKFPKRQSTRKKSRKVPV